MLDWPSLATSPRPPLERAIGLPQAAAMVAGIIIGVSIFVQPAEVSRYVPSVPGIIAVWNAGMKATTAFSISVSPIGLSQEAAGSSRPASFTLQVRS